MSESAEQKRTRRRWINLAELVGVLGLLIGALSLWMNWREARDSRHEQAAVRAEGDRVRSTLLLVGTPVDGGKILSLADPDHRVQRVSVQFPRALGVAAHEALVEPRIEADWGAEPLLRQAKNVDTDHQGRTPVLITADWWDADAHRTNRAIYDLVWRTQGRFLRGHVLRLDGVLLRERGGSAARLESIWAREKPKG